MVEWADRRVQEMVQQLPFPPRNQCHTETIISVKLETLHYTTERFLKLNQKTNLVSNQSNQCSINLSIRKEEIDNFMAMFRKEEREKKPIKNTN